MKANTLFLAILAVITPSCKLLSGKKKNDSNPVIPQTKEEILHSKVYYCEKEAKAYDPKVDTCVNAHDYCVNLKDGSIWDGEKSQCLSLELQCLNKKGYIFADGICKDPMQQCKEKGAGFLWMNNQCLTSKDACIAQGYRYKWVGDANGQFGSCIDKTFMDYCQDKNPPQLVKNTLDILQIRANATGCSQTYSYLKENSELRLNTNEFLRNYDTIHSTKLAGKLFIEELGPLSEFINIENLQLTNNKIVDLAPLSRMSGLKILDLQNNQVKDLKPLGILKKLQTLYVGRNLIETMDGLESLTNLTTLQAFTNHIVNLNALENLAQLKVLYLGGNAIASVLPLRKLNNLEELDLASNPISSEGFIKKDSNCPTGDDISPKIDDFCKM